MLYCGQRYNLNLVFLQSRSRQGHPHHECCICPPIKLGYLEFYDIFLSSPPLSSSNLLFPVLPFLLFFVFIFPPVDLCSTVLAMTRYSSAFPVDLCAFLLLMCPQCISILLCSSWTSSPLTSCRPLFRCAPNKALAFCATCEALLLCAPCDNPAPQ